MPLLTTMIFFGNKRTFEFDCLQIDPVYKSALQSSFDHRAWEEAKRQFLLLHGPSLTDPQEEKTKEDMETTESSVIRTTQVGRLKK